MHIITALAATLVLLQAQPAKPIPAGIEAAAFMAGAWEGTDPKEISEEIWLPPAADSMIGMWRWAVDGKIRLYELLTIGREGNGIAMRLRHFRGDLTALEPQDKPFVLPLVHAATNEAVFEGIGSDGGPLRITYRRTAPDRLEASVEKAGSKETFTYRLKR